MTIARLVHGEVRALAARPFVESAVALGVGDRGCWSATFCRTPSRPVIVAAALGVGNAIMLEAGLVVPRAGGAAATPSWGNLIASGPGYPGQRAMGGDSAGGGAGAGSGGGDAVGRCAYETGSIPLNEAKPQ